MMIMDSKHLMWLLMRDEIYHYLLVNSPGREDGYQKAMIHNNLCNIFLAGHFMCEVDRASNLHYGWYDTLHKATQELTDWLDESIGFPVSGEPDYNKFAPLFFDKFFDLATEAISKSEAYKFPSTEELADIKEIKPGD